MLCEYRDIAEVPLCFLPYFLACSILKVVPAMEKPAPVMRTRNVFPTIFVPHTVPVETVLLQTRARGTDFASHVISVSLQWTP